MSWFSLHALISLYGAELNAALARRRPTQELEQQQFDLTDGSPQASIVPDLAQ